MQTSEYRKAVTERLIGMLESGTAPWQKPWDAGIAAMNRPHNFNGRPYHGVNALMLWCTAIDKGYEDPRWLTFKQVNKLGGHVNKGEKAQIVEYWQWEKEVENPETGEKEKVPLEHPKVYRAAVFNADQCTGLPKLRRQAQEWSPVERAENIIAANGVPVTHNTDGSAFYSPGGDFICMPPRESFATVDAYYSTLLHEVGHSTGHPARLNREFGGQFGSEGYAREELRAELASTFLCGELGIATTGSDEQHAAYVKSWVSALKNDYNEIFRAAADAEKICNYLYEREKEYLQLKEQGIEPQVKQAAAEIINGEQVLMRMTPEERRSKENTLPQDIVTVQLAETIPLRGKDVFIINDKIYIGDREYYGNNGLYDNSDNTLEYVSSNPHLLHFVSGREFAYSAESMLKREELDRADFEEYKALKETGVLAKYENIRVGDVSFEGKPFDEVYANMAFIENVPTYDFPFVLVQNARERDAGIIDEIENGEHYGVSPLRFVKYLDIDGSDPISSMNEVLLKAKERLNESDEKLNMPATSRQKELLDYFGVAYKTDITCNNAENLLKNVHITREQIDYAHKKGFYDDMSKQEDFTFARFCYSAALVSKNEKLKELKNMAKDEKSALMPASDAQKGFLVSLGAKFENDITKGEADRIIKERVAKRSAYFEKINAPATSEQKETLAANNCKFADNITVGEASKIIGQLHATVEQMDYMDKLKISYPAEITINGASKLIEQKMREFEARDNSPATDKQIAALKAHGIQPSENITRAEARAQIYLSPATEKQIKYLNANKIEYDKDKICYGRAGYLIEKHTLQLTELRSQPATEYQLDTLDKMQIKYGKEITKGEAYDIIKKQKQIENAVTEKQVKKAEALGIELPKNATRAEAAQQIELKVRENKIAEFVSKEANPDAYDKYLELANKQYAKTGDFSKIDDNKIAREMLKQGFEKQSVVDAITEHSPVGRDYARADKTVEAAAKTPAVAKAMAKAKDAEKGR
ncbi:MAG TPA: DUF1738 domain-containing protein [Candidatus Fusicatenibacter intestinipullorum]|nr:DUF1738 domain-containing protein [Candidatus Fusicatenibacter intestinipullorum]